MELNKTKKNPHQQNLPSLLWLPCSTSCPAFSTQFSPYQCTGVITPALILIICYAPELDPLSSVISSVTGLSLLPAQLSKEKKHIMQTQHPFLYLIARLFHLYPEIGQPSLMWLHCTFLPPVLFPPICPQYLRLCCSFWCSNRDTSVSPT